MFQFPAFALASPVTGLQPAGFPHSDISGSFPVCRSPELFAAYHVFLRLRKPRHPPFALLLFLVLRESYATLTVSYFLVFAYFEIAVLFATRKNSNFFSDLISFTSYLVISLNIVNDLHPFRFRKGVQRYSLFLKKQIISENFSLFLNYSGKIPPGAAISYLNAFRMIASMTS